MHGLSPTFTTGCVLPRVNQLPTFRHSHNPASSHAVEHHLHIICFSTKDVARNMPKLNGRSTSDDMSTDRMYFRGYSSNAQITRIAFLTPPPQTLAK